MIKDKAQVIMLPTEDKSNILLHKQNRSLFYSDKSILEDMLLDNPQHLYIVSDEEIKEGDWVLATDTNIIFKVSNKDIKGIRDFPQNYRKIIATTDISLGIAPFGGQDVLTVPQPSQDWIEYFIKEYNKGNIITDVFVEYEKSYCKPCRHHCNWVEMECNKWIPKLKVSKDNTITIHPIKQNFSREEVEKLLQDLTSYYALNEVNIDINTCNEFIKENL